MDLLNEIYLNIKYFLKNWYFVTFTSKIIPKSFAGYGRFRLAKKYADKRTASGSPDGVTGRKRHFIISFDTNIVIVCNKTEIDNMVKSGVIKHQNCYQLMRDAYYISK